LLLANTRLRGLALAAGLRPLEGCAGAAGSGRSCLETENSSAQKILLGVVVVVVVVVVMRMVGAH